MTSADKQRSTKSEILEVHAITRGVPAGLGSALVGKEGRTGSVVSGSPWSHGEKQFPCLEYIWEKGHNSSRDKRPHGHH